MKCTLHGGWSEASDRFHLIKVKGRCTIAQTELTESMFHARVVCHDLPWCYEPLYRKHNIESTLCSPLFPQCCGGLVELVELVGRRVRSPLEVSCASSRLKSAQNSGFQQFFAPRRYTYCAGEPRLKSTVAILVMKQSRQAK